MCGPVFCIPFEHVTSIYYMNCEHWIDIDTKWIAPCHYETEATSVIIFHVCGNLMQKSDLKKRSIYKDPQLLPLLD